MDLTVTVLRSSRCIWVSVSARASSGPSTLAYGFFSTTWHRATRHMTNGTKLTRKLFPYTGQGCSLPGSTSLCCAADASLTPWCGERFFSQSAFSADFIPVFVTPPPHTHTQMCAVTCTHIVKNLRHQRPCLCLDTQNYGTHWVSPQRGNMISWVAGELWMVTQHYRITILKLTGC